MGLYDNYACIEDVYLMDTLSTVEEILLGILLSFSLISISYSVEYPEVRKTNACDERSFLSKRSK